MNFKMINNLIILGASGHGKVIADIALILGYNINFWDDDELRKLEGYKVYQRRLEVPKNSCLLIGIGNNKIREFISTQYAKDLFISLKHPTSVVSGGAQIGIGTVVMSSVCVNVGSIIGEHCILNTNCVVDHDCDIDDFVHISPNATLCGNVKIGRGTWVGAGATIIQGVKVGVNVTVGAGAVILNDVPDNVTVVGNPAKIIK